jgi:V/A-type H+-transporting ATPase subunit E
MAVEEIVEKILAEAARAAGSVKLDSDQQMARLSAELEREEREIGQAAEKRTSGEAGEIVKRRVSSARLEARKRILGEKESIVREVYAEVKDRILSLPDEAYLDLLGTLVVRHGEGGDQTVMLCARDRDRLKGSLPQWEHDVSRRLVEAGRPGSVSIADETREIEGGLVLSQGRVEVNLSLEVIIDQTKYLLEADVVRILFER